MMMITTMMMMMANIFYELLLSEVNVLNLTFITSHNLYNSSLMCALFSHFIRETEALEVKQQNVWSRVSDAKVLYMIISSTISLSN